MKTVCKYVQSLRYELSGWPAMNERSKHNPAAARGVLLVNYEIVSYNTT